MNVLELDGALIEKIVSQSDDQSGHLKVRQLEGSGTVIWSVFARR